MNKFKIGDRVYASAEAISKSGAEGIETSGIYIIQDIENNEDAWCQLKKKPACWVAPQLLVPIEIYNSPLFQALKEND